VLKPDLKESLIDVFDALEDSDILFHFMVLINFINSQVSNTNG